MYKKTLMHTLPAGIKPPQDVYCYVEIPKGSTNKYEYDHSLGVFRLDRVLYEAVFYPTEYGFIPKTWSKTDSDPLDIMVLSTYPTFPGCLLSCRPIGLIKLVDSGEQDNKIIAVPKDDPRFEEIRDLNDLTAHQKKELTNFWENYSELQPKKKIVFKGWGNKKAAQQIIEKAIIDFGNAFPDEA